MEISDLQTAHSRLRYRLFSSTQAEQKLCPLLQRTMGAVNISRQIGQDSPLSNSTVDIFRFCGSETEDIDIFILNPISNIS